MNRQYLMLTKLKRRTNKNLLRAKNMRKFNPSVMLKIQKSAYIQG